jgi:hydroxysqualene dehydroxylase
MKVAIIGAGWAGMAAAVAATQGGHQVTVFEASRSLGGRARALEATLPNGTRVTLDNGQHILIGAYTDTLRLMREVGVDLEATLLRLPLSLRFPDGTGLQFPLLPAPWSTFFPASLDALIGILRARGWTWRDKLALLRLAGQWQRSGFVCDASLTVAELCAPLTPCVLHELIEPLCVSALNTPASQASAAVFLRVMQDALFGVRGGSHLLLPLVDLSGLFPAPAARWLAQHGGQVRLGHRVSDLRAQGAQWVVDEDVFDAVVLAASSSNVTRALSECAQAAPESIASQMHAWADITQRLQFEAITTVYTWAPHASLAAPVLALRSDDQNPAQFVFDRGQLGGPTGLLAWVVSASTGERDALQAQVLQQARSQLGLELQAVQTVVEKRATFACTPGLQRPPALVAPGLLACGDYVAGPYPATLEGAVRSGLAAALRVNASTPLNSFELVQ